jgi:hypothetical protein
VGAAVGGTLGGLAAAGAGRWLYKNRYLAGRNQAYQAHQAAAQAHASSTSYVQMQEVDAGGEDHGGQLQ